MCPNTVFEYPKKYKQILYWPAVILCVVIYTFCNAVPIYNYLDTFLAKVQFKKGQTENVVVFESLKAIGYIGTIQSNIICSCIVTVP